MTVDLLDWSGLADPTDAAPPDEPPDEPPDLPDDPRDSADDWPHCEVCGDAIEWSGRGRRPKKCAEHRRRTSVSSGTGPTVRKLSRAEGDRLARLELSLAKQGIKFGAITSRILPVTGATIVRRAENTAAAIVKVCADKPEYLAILEKVAAFEAVMDLAEFLAALVVAVGVDMGQVNPESVVAQMLDVTDAWREVNDDTPMEEPAAPQYEGVGAVVEPRTPMFGPGILPTFTPIGAGS